MATSRVTFAVPFLLGMAFTLAAIRWVRGFFRP